MSTAPEMAFPGDPHWVAGLTKRELFAAIAMHAMRSSGSHNLSDSMARMAVQDADALLAQLAK